MKNCLALLLILLMACRKDKAPTPQELISGNTWSGRFVNPEAQEEPFSITFGADGKFLLKEQRGKYAGVWALEGQHLKATFALPGNTLTADVGADGKMSNINCSVFTIKSCHLNKDHALPLEKTSWKGVINGNISLEFTFLTKEHAVVAKQGEYEGEAGYYYIENGAVSMDVTYDLNGATDYFFFVREGNTMTGVLFVDKYFDGIRKRQYWTATKQ